MWTDLDVRHLLALRAVAEEGTFGKAATRLGFTQSAVSHQIASLEQVVDARLFDRPSGPRRPTLTPAGRVVLRHAEIMLAQLETAEVELDRHRRGIAGTIAIGTFQSMTAVVLPTTISHFRREAPDIEIRLVQEDPLTNYLDLLFTGELDACLTVGPTPDSVNSLLLGLDPHVAVVDPSTPAGPVDTYSFSGQPMIGQPKTDACQQLVDTELERLGITSNYVFNSYDNGAVQAMVGAGMGIAIMPLLTVDPGDTSVAIRQLDPPLEPRMISVVWDKDRTPSAATERFIEIMASVCEQKLAHAAEVGPRR